MRRAPVPFGTNDLTIFRICERMKWTLSQWYALPDWEQIEWLAREKQRQKIIRRALKNLIRTEDGQKIMQDWSAYMHLYMELI